MRKTQFTGETPSRQTLHALYVEGGLSLQETGLRVGGASTTLVKRWLREYGLGPRTVAEARHVAAKHGYSEETLAAMRLRAAEMRKRLTAESFAKISAANKGRVPHNKGQKTSEETREKMRALWTDERREYFAAMRRGEKNQHWKDGSRAGDRLRTWQWRIIKREIFERDNWTCQECGRDCSLEARMKEGHRIQCHHKRPKKAGGTEDPSNLTTLCASCHAKIEWRTYGGFF